MSNKKGFISMTLVYTFLIVFLFLMLSILTSYSKRNEFIDYINKNAMDNAAIDYITINASNSTWYNGCTSSNSLGCKILANNTAYADNVASAYVTGSTGIDFSNISSDTNGKGLYYTTNATKTENGVRVYYYRGAVANNYVIFGGFCWKIIRTNEDGSTKLFYWGTPTDNTCSTTATKPASLSSTKFNQTYNDNTYVGYMMGIDNQCLNTTTCTVATNTTTSLQAQSNIYSSNMKVALDNWYYTNIVNKGTNITNLVANTIYCNDRSTVSGNGYGTNYTKYGTSTRLNDDFNPQYMCPQDNDKFTLKVEYGGTDGYGNNALTYPIGLITADEVVYAGGKYNTANSIYFLFTNNNYWTMSPYLWSSNYSYMRLVQATGGILNDWANADYYVFPSISLINSATVSTGNGNPTTPYIVN